jgi:poly(3-hydroxybutyrate) depolymerase
MLYALQEYGYYAATPLRFAARATRELWGAPTNPWAQTELGRRLFASADLLANVTRRYGKPAWRIDQTMIDGSPVRVRPVVEWSSPWCRMIHFARDRSDLRRLGRTRFDPTVLIVAPLSGHYATLLRGTVEAFLPDHEVYVTDWTNAREVPVMEGRFDFHDYIDHVRTMLAQIGPRPHVVGVCQPGPPVLAAAAIMAAENDPNRPASMTFMGSPIDARLNPTAANKLAGEKPFTWFQDTMIDTVPAPYAGTGRRVYPGFVQLYSFMSMNADKHKEAHREYFEDLVKGDGEGAGKHLEFYDEYLSVLDLTEEFYLQTIEIVFQKHLLPRGLLEHRGRRVRPELIKDIALMTVEGEKDDISGVGQTQAAHRICSGIPDRLKVDYVQPEVGHYGVFNGRRFREQAYPKMRDFIAVNDLMGVRQTMPASTSAEAAE